MSRDKAGTAERAASGGAGARLDSRAIYERFRGYPGSQYIAKAGAVRGVSEQVAATRPARILEVGAGIGTLTYTILATLEMIGHRAKVVSIEHDPFCLDALPRNVGPALAQVEIRPDSTGLEPGAFDLVIVDGGTLERGAYTELVARHGRLIVEGFREHQRTAIRSSGRHCSFREVWHGSAADGGYWVIQFEPTVLERAGDALFRARRSMRNHLAHWGRRLGRRGAGGA